MPTEVPYFKDYYVHFVSLGEDFSIIKASPKDNRDNLMLFSIGNVHGINTDGKTADGILHLSQFDNQNIKLIDAGEKQVVFVYDGELKASDNVGIHHGYKCEVTGQVPIKGTIHFYKDESANWHFLSRDGYNHNKHMLPAV